VATGGDPSTKERKLLEQWRAAVVADEQRLLAVHEGECAEREVPLEAAAERHRLALRNDEKTEHRRRLEREEYRKQGARLAFDKRTAWEAGFKRLNAAGRALAVKHRAQADGKLDSWKEAAGEQDSWKDYAAEKERAGLAEKAKARAKAMSKTEAFRPLGDNRPGHGKEVWRVRGGVIVVDK
jgi:hypothetical protein